MWSKQLLASLRLFAIFGAINASGEEPCIEAAPVKNFDSNFYAGLWYGYGNQDKTRTNLACLIVVLYPRQDDDTYRVVRLWTDSDNSKHMLLTNAQMDETGQGVNAYGHTQTVVATDYKSFRTILGCDTTNNERIVWVSTRTASPTDESLQPAKDVLSKYNMNINDLHLVDKNSCPDDWSDAEKDEKDFSFDEVEDDLKTYGLVK